MIQSVSKTNRYLTEQEIWEIITGNDSDYTVVKWDDDFSSEESKNDVNPSNISNTVYIYIYICPSTPFRSIGLLRSLSTFVYF